MKNTKTEAVSGIIKSTGKALESVDKRDLHDDIKSEIKSHLIDAQSQSIKFAEKLYSAEN